jgi:Arc/MetJ family transcription regulator
MRTNVEIDEKLMSDLRKATGLKTKREIVDYALKLALRLKRQEQIKKLRGKFHWEGDLEKMRLD